MTSRFKSVLPLLLTTFGLNCRLNRTLLSTPSPLALYFVLGSSGSAFGDLCAPLNSRIIALERAAKMLWGAAAATTVHRYCWAGGQGFFGGGGGGGDEPRMHAAGRMDYWQSATGDGESCFKK